MQEAEAGKKARELCRQHGISEATYDHWQAQDGGMSASDLKRLKASEGAVTQYKRRSAELARRDRDVMEALNGVVEERPRWGFWMCSHRLRLLGQGWPHKRVDRIYKAMKLNLPRRPKRRLPARVPQPMEVAARGNAEWSMDCMVSGAPVSHAEHSR